MGNAFTVSILGIENRVFNFKTTDKIDAISWYNEIKRHIEYSDGFKEKKSAAGMKEPWRFDNISEN